MLVFYLVLLLPLTLSRQSCPANEQLSNFEANSLNLYFTGNSFSTMTPQKYQKPFKGQFTSIPSVAISINEMEIFFEEQKSLKSFQIIKDSTTQSSIVFKFVTKSHNWLKFSIFYWVSCREDLVVGQKEINYGSLKANKQQNVQIENMKGQFMRSFVRVFINGAKLNQRSSSLSLKIQARASTASSLVLQVILGDNIDLNSLWFSYVLFSPFSSEFYSYGGVVLKKQTNGIEYEKIYHQEKSNGFFLMGLTKLQMKNGLNFTSSMDINLLFSYSIGGKQVNLAISYIIIGVKSKDVCSHCEFSTYFSGSCLQNCPTQTYLSKQTCRTCPQILNQQINSQQNGCQCKQGYLEEKLKCIKAPSREEIGLKKRNQALFSMIEYSLNTEELSQQKSPVFSQNCLFIPNSFWNGQECVCKSGFQRNKSAFCEKIGKGKCSKSVEKNGKICVCTESKQKYDENGCEVTLCPKEVCHKDVGVNCGNGIMNENQNCDDGNNFNNDGCSSTCRIEQNSGCYHGQPSICYRASYNIRLSKPMEIKREQILIEVETYPTFTFEDQGQMQNFLRFSFTSSEFEPSHIQCKQRKRRLSAFNCSLFYPNKIPKPLYKLQINFKKEKKRGYMALIIDRTASRYFS